MANVDFVFAIHNHQPVGNFDFVIEDAYQRSYSRFLQTLEEHPGIRFCLHQPGILWEWIEQHHPEFLERVRVLVQRGQVELLTGGHYEPILPVIPERDRQSQIRALTAWLNSRFDVEPRGAWLAERVWEPQLAATMVRAGLDFTVVDDSHFSAAGLTNADLTGYYLTEDDGQPLRVFPIAQPLRYALPFSEPEETIAWMREQSRHAGNALLVHADDGEKFGVWPGTHKRCYEEGWLQRFLTALEENSDWLHTKTFSQAMDTRPPKGRVYLPTASYAEMGEWSLPVPAQARLRAALERAGDQGDASFVRGGFWRNFLARYPESNWMHKKMLYVSRRVDARARANGDGPWIEEARTHLLRSQCNCAYWHGLFGGLYLPHLRAAVYSELIRAETLLDAHAEHQPAIECLDFDADGSPEVLLRSPEAVTLIKPDRGGAVFEFDSQRYAFNVLDVMTRRPEAYHELLRQLDDPGHTPAEGAVSIHKVVRTKEPGLHRALVFDRYRRGAFVDHLVPYDARFEDFASARLPELAALANAPYDFRVDSNVVHLERVAPLTGAMPTEPMPAHDAHVRVLRGMRLDDAGLTGNYEVHVEGSVGTECRFAIEMVANLLAGDAPDRWIEVDGERLSNGHLASRGELDRVLRIDLVDAWRGMRVVIETAQAMDVWRTPLESVSMSEEGFERVYQGSALLLLSRQPMRPDKPWRGSLQMRVEAL